MIPALATLLVPLGMLAAQAGPVVAQPAVESGFPYNSLIAAFLLLAAAVVLLGMEFLLISWGLLAVASLACALSACAYAFAVSPAFGWSFVVVTPVLGVLVAIWGLAKMQRSRVVPRAEITADAGYHHAVEALGIAVGSAGVMVTDAFPAGRARFVTPKGGGEVDVEVHGAVARRGDPVVVAEISGGTVAVRKASAETIA